MEKEFIQKLILSFIIFALLVSLNLLAFASNAVIEINCPTNINFGENFDVSLKVPENTYGLEATVTLKYSNGNEESQRLVYIEGLADTKNLLTFNAKVAGNAEIVFSNIILCDKDSNVIETEKTKTKSIKIVREINGLSLDYRKATIDISKQNILKLNPIISPIDSTDIDNITWSSSDETVATVDKNGLVTAKKAGIVNITAKCKEYSAVCDISVKKSIIKIKIDNPITEEYIYNSGSVEPVENSSYTWELGKYGYMSFGLQAYPSDASEIGEIKWTSSNDSIIRIEPYNETSSYSPSYYIPGYGQAKEISKVKVYTVGPGKATITATCGDIIDTYEIEVISPITKFALNKNTINLYYNKSTNKKTIGKLDPIIEPYNTTDSKVVSWSTSDSSIATVENGIVTPSGIGKATIVARCGNFTASCEVNVSDEIINTTLDVKNISDNKSAILVTSKIKVENFLIEENFPVILFNTVKIFDINGSEKNLSDKVCSKDIIKILDSKNNIISEYTLIVKGDINCDGDVKMYDAFQILKRVLFGTNLDELDALIMDYNGDGKIKMYDAFSFLKYSLFN